MSFGFEPESRRESVPGESNIGKRSPGNNNMSQPENGEVTILLETASLRIFD